jgi:hypothetical protein
MEAVDEDSPADEDADEEVDDDDDDDDKVSQRGIDLEQPAGSGEYYNADLDDAYAFNQWAEGEFRGPANFENNPNLPDPESGMNVDDAVLMAVGNGVSSFCIYQL